MTLYRYKAITRAGEVAEDEMEAASEAAVISRLKEVGHLPVRVEQIQARNRSAAPGLFSRTRGISRNQLNIFTRELARLIGAGVSLDKSLSILAAVADDDASRNLVTRLIEEIRGGATFADALEGQGTAFSRLYISMIDRP